MSSIAAFVTAHRVGAYFAVTFAISWGSALVVIGGSGGMQGTTPDSDPRFAAAVAAMLLGPSVAGIGMTAFVSGRAGLRDLLSRLLTWRVGASCYAVALLTAPLLMAATLLALSFTSPAFLPGLVVSENTRALLLVSVAVGVSAGLFEELGWTGFATPALRNRHGLFATGVILGIWWSAWHLLPNVWAARAAAGELAMPVYLTATAAGIVIGYLTAFRVLMVWVYERTGSVLLGILMHVSLTASLLILNPIGIAGANLQLLSFAFAVLVWAVVAAVPVRRR